MAVFHAVSKSPLDAILFNSSKNSISYLSQMDGKTDRGESDTPPFSLREAGDKETPSPPPESETIIKLKTSSNRKFAKKKKKKKSCTRIA